MNRVLLRLEALREVPPEILAFGALALVLLSFLIPKYYRLGASLAFLSAWLNISRFTGLGVIASFSKVTFWLPILLVILAALLHPGKKRSVSQWMYVYLVIPFIGMACVATTKDATLGLVYQLNMLLVSLTAFCVLRTIVDVRSLAYTMLWLGIGLMIPLGICTYAMVLGGHFRPGLGRFTPYGTLSNQLVPMLLQVIVIGLFLFHHTRSLLLKIMACVLVGLAGAQLIATGSRQGLATMMIVLVPWALVMIRRPLVAALFVVVASASFLYVFGFLSEATGIGRLSSIDDSSRIEIAQYYLDVIATRPAVGLLGSRNQSSIIAEGAISHSHNAYIESFYIGGIAYGGPLLLVVAATAYSIIFVFWHRKRLAFDLSQFLLLSGLMVAIYAQGFASNMAFTSVSSLSFINYLLSGFFLSLRADVRNELKAERSFLVAQ